jgi:NitT/TauT family transport system permease protein
VNWTTEGQEASRLKFPDTPPAEDPGKGETVRQPASSRVWLSWSDHNRDRVLAAVAPLALLIVWEALARSGAIDARYFPPPSRILERSVELIKSGLLFDQVAISLKRLALGFVVGGGAGLVVGLAMGLYRPIRAMLDPLIAATYPIPRSALLPLIFLVFGLGETSKVFMVAMGAFYPLAINTIAGVVGIPQIYRDVAHNYGARGFTLFRTMALPGAMPLIMAGLKLAVGMSLILIVIAEMFGADSGLGFMLYNAWQVFDVETMYVGLLAIGIIGFLLTIIVDELERRFVPWKGK